MSALTIVTPNDVRALKARLDPFVRAFDCSVAACGELHPFVRGSWADFSRGWRQFAAADTSWLHAAAEYDAAAKYEQHLVAWQTQLAPVCPVLAPPFPRSSRPDASGTLGSTVKTVAIAGAVVAVAFALRGVTR